MIASHNDLRADDQLSARSELCSNRCADLRRLNVSLDNAKCRHETKQTLIFSTPFDFRSPMSMRKILQIHRSHLHIAELRLIQTFIKLSIFGSVCHLIDDIFFFCNAVHSVCIISFCCYLAIFLPIAQPNRSTS